MWFNDSAMSRSTRPGWLNIGTTIYLFYRRLQEATAANEIERQKILEEKKRETKAWFEDYFRTLLNRPATGEDQDVEIEITKKDFCSLLDTEVKSEFCKHFFRLFDSDDSGDVSIQEIQAGLNKLSDSGEANKKTMQWFQNRLEKYSSEDVTEDTFHKAINKNFLGRLFDLMDIDHGGTLNLGEFKRSVDRLLMMGSDEKILLYLENLFHETAEDTENITYEEFKKVVYNKQEYFTKKMFSICDKDGDKSISLQEFTETLGKLMKQSEDEEQKEKINRDKLHFLFRIYDDDNSGEISREEMRACIEVCTKESSLELKDVNVLADTLFFKADTDGSGAISFDEFYTILKPFINDLEINPKGWVIPEKKKKTKDVITEFMNKYITFKYMRNNIVLFSNIAIYVILYVVTFGIGMHFYSDTYLALMIAKGAGKCLNLTSVLLFLTMCRTTLTSVRNTPIGKFIALDAAVEMHKVYGIIYGIFTLTHTAAHVFTFLSMCEDSKLNTTVVFNETHYETEYHIDYSFILNYGGHWGGSYLSGTLLVIVLCVMLPFAHSCVRRGGMFTQFYWVHFGCYWLLALGTIAHCKNFYLWITLPLAIYILEKIANSNMIKKTVYGRFRIINYKILPSHVVELQISRPPTFNFHSGSYAFITIPFITAYEKHPFTISSSAEDKSKITFHIKMQQGWTKKLYEELDRDDKKREENEKNQNQNGEENGGDSIIPVSGKSEWDKLYGNNFGQFTKRDVEVFIDGPYGTPATEIFEAEHAVLIAAGIGVTPFASILQTIVDRYEKSGCVCSKCGTWNDHGTFITKIKKLDFIWITRDQKSLQWFLELLRKLEKSMDKFSERNPNHGDSTNRTKKTWHGHHAKSPPKKKSLAILSSKSEAALELTDLDLTTEVDESETPANGTEHSTEIAEEVKLLETFLGLHIYLTSALSKKDFRAVGLQYALKLMRDGSNEDQITGLKAETNSGRPDWNELFDKLVKKKRKVTVFFCGSPVIEEQLRLQCDKRNFKFKAEKF